MLTLMDIIIEQPFHIIIGEYIGIQDNKNLISLNKEIYNNKISKKYFKKILFEKSKKIIYRFMKKYVNYTKYVNNYYNEYPYRPTSLTKKMNAVYYFRNYEKQYINLWYNFSVGWKKDLINKYKKKEEFKENPSRYDFFKLIKKMNVQDVYDIGW
jgi:hypothetical protein